MAKKILRGLISVISFSLSLIIMWFSVIDVFVCSRTTDTENMFVYDDLSHHWITTDECLIITPEMRDDAVTVEYSYYRFSSIFGLIIKINAVFHYTPEKYDHYLQTLTERYHERVETAEDINQKELTVIILRELEDYEGAYMAFCDDNNTVYFCCYDM